MRTTLFNDRPHVTFEADSRKKVEQYGNYLRKHAVFIQHFQPPSPYLVAGISVRRRRERRGTERWGTERWGRERGERKERIRKWNPRSSIRIPCHSEGACDRRIQFYLTLPSPTLHFSLFTVLCHPELFREGSIFLHLQPYQLITLSTLPMFHWVHLSLGPLRSVTIHYSLFIFQLTSNLYIIL